MYRYSEESQGRTDEVLARVYQTTRCQLPEDLSSNIQRRGIARFPLVLMNKDLTHPVVGVCKEWTKTRHVRLWSSLYRVPLSLSLSIFMFPSLLFACYLRTSYSVGWWVHLARNELRRTWGRRSPAYFESPLSVLCNSSFVCHLPLLY